MDSDSYSEGLVLDAGETLQKVKKYLNAQNTVLNGGPS